MKEKNKFKIAIAGNGRMSKNLVQVADNLGYDYCLINRITDEKILSDCDIMIEFTSLDGLEYFGSLCKSFGLPLVSGSTGLNGNAMERVCKLSKSIPIFWSANMSLGIAYMHRCLDNALLLANSGFNCDVSEVHHSLKSDKTSGTAIEILDTVRRSGFDVGVVSSERIGDIVGEHQVKFESASEEIVIKHSVKNRSLFAVNAINIGVWLFQQRVGYYAMEDYINYILGYN